MKHYRYDEETKEFLHEFTPQADPVTRGFLTPCNATKKPPRPTLKGFVSVFDGREWGEIADYRGQETYNKKTLKSRIVDKLGAIPEDETLVKPADDCQKWESYGWIDDKEKQKSKGNREAKKQRDAAVNALIIGYNGHSYAATPSDLALLEIAHSSKINVKWFDTNANIVALSTTDIWEIIQAAKSELMKIWTI